MFLALKQKRKDSQQRWDEELQQLITALQDPKSRLPAGELKKIASSFLDEVKQGDSHVIKLVLPILALLTHQKADDVMQYPDIEKVLLQAFKRFPGDPQILCGVSDLLNMEEDRLDLKQKPPFEYPPFQRALPYFPSYGYQVILTFKQQQLTRDLQQKISDLLQKLKGYSIVSVIWSCSQTVAISLSNLEPATSCAF